MGKTITTIVDRFDGGITSDARDTSEGVSSMLTNFDILTDTHRMIPYRNSESGDSAASTSLKRNFAIALRTGTTYSLYALGGQAAQPGRAEILYKDLTTGASNDLDDDAWASTSNNQSASGSTSFDLFVYYKKTGYIYGAKAGTTIWAYAPGGGTFDEDGSGVSASVSYTNIAQGLVHSKDDILYIPYDNKIAKNDNGSWTTAALTLPTHVYVTSICEYGNYLAIGCAPLSGVGKSVVYLWDRDSTLATLSESIDWGTGLLKILEEVDGILVGLSLAGGLGGATGITFNDRVIMRYMSGSRAVKLKEFIAGNTSTQLPIAKQKINNRLYFMMSISLRGATREGVWSLGRVNPSSPMTLVHERTPNNDTALSSGTLYNFFVVGDFMFIAYISASVHNLTKTNDTETYTATSIYESKIFNLGESSVTKDLDGVSVMTEAMPTAGQIVLKYKKDEETSFTTIFTNTTDNSIRYSAHSIESTGSALPSFKEIVFRIESTGGAVVTGLKFKATVKPDDSY